MPLDNTLLSRPGPPTSLRRVTKRDPEREVGEQPVLSHQMLWTGAAQNLVVVFFGAMRPYLLVKDSRFPSTSKCPIPRRSQRDPGEGQREKSCAPYPVDPRGIQGRGIKQDAAKCDKPEGRGIVEWLAESCSKFQKDKMLSIFPALVFGRQNANWKKDKMLSIFPSLVFVPCVGRGLQ